MAIYSKNKNTNQKQKNIDENIKLKIGISLVVIFSFLFLNLAFNVLTLFNSFFLGTFGLLSYAIFLMGIAVGVLLILKKSFTIAPKDIVLLVIWLFLFLCIIHLITTTKLTIASYGKYIAATYTKKITAGGIIFSLFTYPLLGLTHSFVSTIILFVIGLVIDSAFVITRFYDYYQLKNSNTETKEDSYEDFDVESIKSVNTTPQFDDSIFIEDEEVEQLEKENKVTELTTTEKDKIKAKKILGLNKDQDIVDEENEPSSKLGKLKDIFSATTKKEPLNIRDDRPPIYVHEDKQPIKQQKNNKKTLSDRERANLEYLRVITGRPLDVEEEVEDTTSQNVNSYSSNSYQSNNTFEDTTTEVNVEPEVVSPKRTPYVFEDTTINTQVSSTPINDAFSRNTFDVEDDNDIYDENLTYDKVSRSTISPVDTAPVFRKPPIIKEDIKEEINLNPIQTNTSHTKTRMEQIVINEVATEKDSDKPKYKKPYHYNRPPIELLNVVHNQNQDVDTNLAKGQALEEVLASLRIPAKVVDIKRGPAFSQFEMQMPTGISVNKVQNLYNDIAMAVQANGSVRLEIPIPGKQAFGVEVPNEKTDLVGIREIIESQNFMNSKSPLAFALGKDITGDAKVTRLDKLVHLLVAGTTGSGKSVCLNTMLISFLYNASPEDLKLILVDPKQLELNAFAGIPHMLIPDVITRADHAAMMLEWACEEMERRYAVMKKFNETYNCALKNISDFNERQEVKAGLYEKIPYLVIILDEVGDLMLTHKKEIEDKIVRLGQKSRAAGIHMVLATQRPSVDIITGTIKANLPSRIAFAVSSVENSKTIIGCGGAENLLGKGDMLFSEQSSPELKRIQGAFVSNEELANVINYVKENNECIFDSDIEDAMFNPKKNSFNTDAPGSSVNDGYDPMLIDAVRTVIRTNKASISGIQRALGVGYPKAGKLIDQMERAGFISAADDKNNRIIFVTKQEFEEKFGEDFE